MFATPTLAHISSVSNLLNLLYSNSNTTGSSAARNLPSISRFVQPRHHTAGVLAVVKKSCFVLFVCV